MTYKSHIPSYFLGFGTLVLDNLYDLYPDVFGFDFFLCEACSRLCCVADLLNRMRRDSTLFYFITFSIHIWMSCLSNLAKEIRDFCNWMDPGFRVVCRSANAREEKVAWLSIHA